VSPGRYVGIGTGLMVGVTGAVWQLNSGSSAAHADVSGANSWTALTGELSSGSGSRTVTLGADIAAPSEASPVVAVPAGSAVTLDLHGHKLALSREAGDLKVIVPHGSTLSMEDTTGGSAGTPASPIPAGGNSGYAGYAGLEHAAAAGQAKPPTQARVFGPIMRSPAEVKSDAGSEHAATTTPAAHPRESVHKPASHRAERAERARGRHRREHGLHRRIKHSHRECEYREYYWVPDDDDWWFDDPVETF
jgi:hypothetical protein